MSKENQISITGSVTGFKLGDLQWLVDAALDAHLSEDTIIHLHVDKGYNQLDAGSSRLSISFQRGVTT